MHQAKTAGRGLQPRPAQPAWGRHSGLNLPCHKFSGLQSSRIWSLGPMDYTISGQHGKFYFAAFDICSINDEF